MFFRDTKDQDISRALGFILAVADDKHLTLAAKGRWGSQIFQSFLSKDHAGIQEWLTEQMEASRRVAVLTNYTTRFLDYQEPYPHDFAGTSWLAFRVPKEVLAQATAWENPAATAIVSATDCVCVGWKAQRTLQMHQVEEMAARMRKQMGRDAVSTCYMDVPFFRGARLVRFHPGYVHEVSAFKPTTEEKQIEREYEKAMAQTMPQGRPPAASVSEYRHEPEQPKSRRLIATSFADIEEEEMNWLVPETIPLGCLTLLGGLPDAGKSQITINLAATVSRGGEWPCGLGKAEHADVLILASEDGDARTIKPRLEAAGADMRRIHSMRTRFSIGENLADLKELGESLPNLRLIVFDPISRYMSGKDANAVRDSVDSFNIWIEQRQIAAVGIRHPPKEAGGAPNVQNLFSGSAEEVRIARAAWFIVGGKAAGMPGSGVMLNAKGNILPDKRGFPYRIEGFTTRAGSVTSRIVWGHQRVDKTAQEFLTDLKSKGPQGALSSDAPTSASSRPDKREQVQQWVHTQIQAAGGSIPLAKLRKAGESKSYWGHMLYEARDAMGLRESGVEGGLNNGVVWHLPESN